MTIDEIEFVPNILTKHNYKKLYFLKNKQLNIHK